MQHRLPPWLRGGAALVACLCTSMPLSAQLAASDASYTITRSTGTTSSIASTGTLLTSNADDRSFFVALASPFSFYGVSYNGVYVSTNGLLSFGVENSNYPSGLGFLRVAPGASAVAVFWGDLRVNQPGLYAQSSGHLTTIEWFDVTYFGSRDQGGITFQATLNSLTGEITMYYTDVTYNGLVRETIGVKGPSSFALVGTDRTLVATGDILTVRPTGTPTTTVPEPSSLALSTLGTLIVGVLARSRRRA